MKRSSTADAKENPTAEMPASITAQPLIEGQVLIPEDIRYTEDDIQNVIVMNTRTGDFYGLDESAAIIWKALLQSRSIKSAVDAVVDVYGIEPNVAADDVRAFVEELTASGLIAVEQSE